MSISQLKEAGPFTFRWPDGKVEVYPRTWTADVKGPGRLVSMRHGLGIRRAYGRDRVRGVTWFDGAPVVEGVEADDFPTSHALLSRVKAVNGRLARRPEDVPEGYEGFALVEHRDNLEGPYSPRGLAVKIREDDVEQWASLALLRAANRKIGGGSWPFQRPAALRARTTSVPVDAGIKSSVATRLIEYDERRNGLLQRGSLPLTPEDPDAEAFVRQSDFAFLLAVIFDQGIGFERAWRAPLLLKERLGHLDPQRMLDNPPAVKEAIGQRPSLHRYVNKMPRWVSAATSRVIAEYGTETGRIWTDVSAVELHRRLLQFAGISQKKAAMTVMLLWRNRNVDIRAMEGCDVAVDIHLRRVFLRAGLCERDAPGEFIAVARTLFPRIPGALDPPAWTIGREFCHPEVPDCERCPLLGVCPRLIDRGHGLVGA